MTSYFSGTKRKQNIQHIVEIYYLELSTKFLNPSTWARY